MRTADDGAAEQVRLGAGGKEFGELHLPEDGDDASNLVSARHLLHFDHAIGANDQAERAPSVDIAGVRKLVGARVL